MMHLSENKKKIFTYTAIFTVLCALCFLFPYTGDDWAWGGSAGLERLETLFDGYGGRYFGNLTVMLLTRSNLLKTIVMSGVITAIIAVLNYLSDRSRLGILVSLGAVTLMPVALLRQSIVWTSGFSNYAVSILLILIYFCEIKDIYEVCPDNNFKKAIPLLLLGFTNSLWVEHITVYSILLGIWVVAFTAFRYKKAVAGHIAYLLGAVCGAAWMFSNSAYRNISVGDDVYRTIAETSIFETAWRNLYKVLIPNAFINNIFLLLVIAVVFTIAIRNIEAEKYTALLKTAYVYILFYCCFCAGLRIYLRLSGDKVSNAVLTAMTIATILFVLCMLAFVWLLKLTVPQKAQLSFFLLSSLFVMAPLVIVSPLGPRCLFASYILLFLFAMKLYSCNDKKVKASHKKLTISCYVAVLCSLVVLFAVYADIYSANQERISKAISDSKVSREIEISPLPNKQFVWYSDLIKDSWQGHFKDYYGIDKNVKIIYK